MCGSRIHYTYRQDNTGTGGKSAFVLVIPRLIGAIIRPSRTALPFVTIFPNCAAPAPSVDGRCAACGVVRADDWEGATFISEGALFPPASAPPAGAADVTQWPTETITRRAFTEAQTDAGLGPEEATGHGLQPARKSVHSAVATATPVPPSITRAAAVPVPRALGGVPIDPDATIVSDPDDTGVVDRNLTTYVRRPEDETRAGGPDESPTGFDRTRLGMPEGIVVKPTDGPSGPLAPGRPFGPRYHIMRLLGIGGMGAVYQAWDAELGVAVAIKVIRPEVAGRPRRPRRVERRFKRELLLARQVTHKNVVRIHDLGEIDGIKYITMPYVEGDGSRHDPQARREAADRADHADRARHRVRPRWPRTRPASFTAI